MIETQLIQVDASQPESDVIARAAEIIRSGGLVAFPTETVYGLGANALDPAAVVGIFEAKGRPSNNPVIVHVLNTEEAEKLAVWTREAQALALRFWPGPLTIVLARRPIVPDAVTGGGDTVALRSPSHPVARALIAAASTPIAAPSANLSERISPTTAAHVLQGLDGRISMILDGGATSGGIESTVISIAGHVPVLLRPGLVSPAEIEAVIGPIARASSSGDSDTPLAAPGMMARHYAPRAILELTHDVPARLRQLRAKGERLGLIIFGDESVEDRAVGEKAIHIYLPSDPFLSASQLYAALHQLDAAGVTRIIVQEPPITDSWLAIWDRLKRAATPR